MRTPLAAVIGLADLLTESQLTTDQSETIQTIRENGVALLSLVDDALDFSRLDAGRLELRNEPFDLHDCIESVLRQYPPDARRGLGLGLSIGPRVPRLVIGDALRLRQSLTNLVTNALKFTPHGGVQVSVRVEEDQPDAPILRFSVSDTGVGIPRERIDTIFDPFVQGTPSTARRYGGAGLGLAITRRLVELMGGVMQVESEPDRGSIFSFNIPARVADMQQLGDDLKSDDNLELPPRQRVLVIDDNRMNRRLMTALLERMACPADTAASGAEAFSALDRGEYDVVLLDIHMPDVDGLTVAQRLTEHPRTERRPYIAAMTASVSAADRAACATAGMDDFLVKPVTAGGLCAVLRRAARAPQAVSQVDVESPAPNVEQPGDVPLSGAAWQQLLELIEQDSTVLTELLAHLDGDTRKHVDCIRAALRDSDAGQLCAAAHGIRGCALNIGAERLAALSAALERQGRGGVADISRDAVDALSTELDEVRRALEAQLDGRSSRRHT